jgi:hypothetical protein
LHFRHFCTFFMHCTLNFYRYLSQLTQLVYVVKSLSLSHRTLPCSLSLLKEKIEKERKKERDLRKRDRDKEIGKREKERERGGKRRGRYRYLKGEMGPGMFQYHLCSFTPPKPGFFSNCYLNSRIHQKFFRNQQKIVIIDFFKFPQYLRRISFYMSRFSF